MLDEYKKDSTFFLETALIAIKQGDEKSAKQIVNAFALLDPGNVMVQMCYGLIHMHKLELVKAIDIFSHIIQAEPDNYRAMGFLAFSKVATVLDEKFPKQEKAHQMAEGVRLAQQIVQDTSDSSTKALAHNVLLWVDEMKNKTGMRLR